MQKLFFLSFLMLTAVVSGLRAQDCPRIFQRGDTLYTDPAPQYQWFRDNNPINGANKQWHLPTSKGNFSVEISATAPQVSVNPTLGRVIAGRIIDERYEPIADATISVGQFNTKSDATGAFRLENIKILTENAVVTITKAGFWKNVQHVHFFDPNFAPLTAMLEPLKITNRFDAQKGATISERGFFLTFPPNSAVTEDGKTYKGTIALSLKRSFPSEDGFGLRMPGGDFSAIDANGQEKMLVSYGFMSAELHGQNGEKLRLAPDTEATLEFYIPWEQNKTAPDSMPLWHFDETAGTWRPEGTARKVGPRYVGTVKHFSSWNCDYPRPAPPIPAIVKGRVVDCKKNPLPLSLVNVGQRFVTTDKTGHFSSFAIPQFSMLVTTQVDTAKIDALQEAEIKVIPDLNSTFANTSVGLIDSTGTLTVYGYGVTEYSIDSRKTFHPKNIQLKLSDSFPKQGIARDSSGCETKFRIFNRPKTGDCQLLSYGALSSKPSHGISGALSTNETVYKLVISQQFEIEIVSVFPCLQVLNAGQITSVPESIGQLTNLQELTIGNSQLNSLPNSFWQLINLRRLVINNTQSVPESIGQLTNLQYLYLISGNQLTNLPESIGQLTNLQTLYLSGSQLTGLPESIGLLTNLQTLSITGSPMTSLTESIGELTTLQNLYLNETPVRSLPESIANLKVSLKTLDLRGTHIPPAELAKIRSWLPNTAIYF